MFKLNNVIKRWLQGYIFLEGDVYYVERLINGCINLGINLWKINACNDKICFYIRVKDLYRIKALLRRTCGKIKISKKRGFPFVCSNILDNKFLYLGGLAAFFIIFILSRFIWAISIVGNYTYTDVEFKDVLREIGIEEGMNREDVDCDSIEAYLRDRYFDIKWVSAQLKGTVLNIQLRENSESEAKSSETLPSDIIATENGIVRAIITRSGVPKVKVGDKVEKGQILISGAVPIYNDSEELINTHYVAADGRVDVEVRYIEELELSEGYLEKYYTGRKKHLYSIYAFEKELYIKAAKTKYKDYNIVSDCKQIVVGDSFYLPLGVRKTVVKEYELIHKAYTPKQAENILLTRIQEFIRNLENKGGTDIKGDYHTGRKNDVYIAHLEITAIMPAYKNYDIVNKY